MVKLLGLVGLLIAGVGLLMVLGVPIGRFPGDLMFRRGNTTIYFPIVTSIVLSVVVSVLLVLLRR